MSKKDSWIWMAAAAGGAYLLYNFAQQQGLIPAAATPTPLSVYPEYAYTAAPQTTTMAASPTQQAPAALVPPTPQFTSVQSAEQSAIYGQCIGANVCSPVTGDTQLGF